MQFQSCLTMIRIRVVLIEIILLHVIDFFIVLCIRTDRELDSLLPLLLQLQKAPDVREPLVKRSDLLPISCCEPNEGHYEGNRTLTIKRNVGSGFGR